MDRLKTVCLKAVERNLDWFGFFLALEIFIQNLPTGIGEGGRRKSMLAWSLKNTAADVFPVDPMHGGVLFKNDDDSAQRCLIYSLCILLRKGLIFELV